MTGAELKVIRKHLGLTTTEMGRAFGYEGSDVTASGTIRKYESEARPIPPWLGRLAIMFDRNGVPPEFLETRGLQLDDLRKQIAASGSIEVLCGLLNAFERLRKDLILEEVEIFDMDLDDEIDEVPSFDHDYDRDWSDFRDAPLSIDADNVLFRESTGRYYFMSRADIEAGDEED